MLDELCEDYHYERKYAIKLLGGSLPLPSGRVHPGLERRYELIEPVVKRIWLQASACNDLFSDHSDTLSVSTRADSARDDSSDRG
jgi:hypothetical protein